MSGEDVEDTGNWTVKQRAPDMLWRLGWFLLTIAVCTIAKRMIYGTWVDSTDFVTGFVVASLLAYFEPPKIVTFSTFRTPAK